MKTEIEWEQDIINITMRIHQEFPELSKYIEEVPLDVSGKDKEVINIKTLKAYYNSLEEMLVEYSKTHEGKERH